MHWCTVLCKVTAWVAVLALKCKVAQSTVFVELFRGLLALDNCNTFVPVLGPCPSLFGTNSPNYKVHCHALHDKVVWAGIRHTPGIPVSMCEANSLDHTSCQCFITPVKVYKKRNHVSLKCPNVVNIKCHATL